VKKTNAFGGEIKQSVGSPLKSRPISFEVYGIRGEGQNSPKGGIKVSGTKKKKAITCGMVKNLRVRDKRTPKKKNNNSRRKIENHKRKRSEQRKIYVPLWGERRRELTKRPIAVDDNLRRTCSGKVGRGGGKRD